MTERTSLRTDRSQGRPQMSIGFVATSNWGEGDERAKYAVGDIVFIPEDAPAVAVDRCEAGLHRVESCFSIGENASFYYRVSPTKIVNSRGAPKILTDWNQVSDRLHVLPPNIDWTLGFVRLYEAATAE